MTESGAALALASRLILAAVFAFSAARKSRGGANTVQSMRGFGLPAPRIAAVAVTAAELVLAAALILWADQAWPSVAAVAVLAAFTVTVLVQLSRGRATPCPCFGASERPVSGATLIRNGWLAALGVVGTGSSAGAETPVTVGLCALLGAVTAVLIRRTG